MPQHYYVYRMPFPLRGNLVNFPLVAEARLVGAAEALGEARTLAQPARSLALMIISIFWKNFPVEGNKYVLLYVFTELLRGFH